MATNTDWNLNITTTAGKVTATAKAVGPKASYTINGKEFTEKKA
jgi:hypothetical protein